MTNLEISNLQKKNTAVFNMQGLINSGAVWTMESSMREIALNMLKVGKCMLPKNSVTVPFGVTMPSRDNVKKGEMGSFSNSVSYYTKLK